MHALLETYLIRKGFKILLEISSSLPVFYGETAQELCILIMRYNLLYSSLSTIRGKRSTGY